MDDNVQYVVGRNVARFYDEFVAETDPSRRHLLRRMLVAEERRYGNCAERLDLTERWVEKCSNHVADHRYLKEKYDRDGNNVLWESIGKNLIEIQQVIIACRDSLREEMARVSF